MKTNFEVRGLTQPVEILVDSNGIPHIYASSQTDAFLAQGFNAARDRLFQLDLWRRRGLGLLAEAFGPSFVQRDRAARLLCYRGDPEDEFEHYGPEAEARITAFVAGINAYIQAIEDGQAPLPFEFVHLGYRPGRFQPEDLVRCRTSAGGANVGEEVARARTLSAFGPEVEALRRLREPAIDLNIPDGLDLSVIPADVLALISLARSAVSLPALLSTTTAAESGEVADGQAGRAVHVGLDGSNNWAVSPARTATGRPLLASDPHRNLTLPSLRYLAHLVAPGMDVIGGGEPALPGISVGHNGKVAFGYTIFAADQEDLYCYETDPDDPRRYRYGDGYESMHTVHESVPVRGGDPVDVELVFTRHGPLIYEDPDHDRAFALRAAWLEPGGAPYLAALALLDAGDVTELLAALDHWVAPGENFVCADTSGNIAWKPAALVPRRPNWDGLLPVPGDGRYEWDGFYARDDFPERVNPDEGFVVTANANEIPPDFPPDVKLGYEWAAPFRRDRIRQVLASGDAMTVREHAELQTDHVSLPAHSAAALARSLPISGRPHLDEAVTLLAGFDGTLDTSPAAALYEVWYRDHLRPALLRRALREHLDESRAEAALGSIFAPDAFAFGKTSLIDIRLLEKARHEVESGDGAIVADVLATVEAALGELSARSGPDPAAWNWTEIHQARPVHPLSRLVGEEERALLDIGQAGRGGDGDTPGCTTSGPNHVQFHGADFRVVIDVGDWDASVAMNSPGQSGDPASRHYRDLFARWAADQTIPLPYSRAAVEAAATERVLLQPSQH